MTQTLTHRPFEAAIQPGKVVRITSGVVRRIPPVVGQPRQPPEPLGAQEQAKLGTMPPTADAKESEPVAAKKKKAWTDEQRAKFRATMAAKKKRGGPVGRKPGKKKRATRGSIEATRKQAASPPKAYGARSIAALLDDMMGALQEIKRRLEQLSL